MPDIGFAAAFIYGDNIESACLVLQLIDMIIPFGNALKLLLFAPIDGIFGLAERIVIRSRLDFDENKLIAIHCNDIDLADSAVGKVALHDTIPKIGNESAGFIFSFMACCLAVRLKRSLLFHNTLEEW